eukprot:symbB.v1.2.034100.t1/scaffold4305.1/size41623/3
MAAVPRELKVKTLDGGGLTVEVMPANTIEELKATLYEKKHCEDPVERKILKIKVLADGLLVDDDQTLESAGLLHAESEVTVIYSTNEVEAATKEAICAEGLFQVNIPSSLTEISSEAFENCNQVVKVSVPESVTTIKFGAFKNCKSLARITIPESVTEIWESAFLGCRSLKSITIPESVTEICESAFLGCRSLKSITIPESVTVIFEYAFRDCSSLESITIPESVLSIGDSAFSGCESLASITLSESVTAIGDYVFLRCSSLESITIPESVTFIGDAAFAECKSLVSITLPESVTDIGCRAFRRCKSLESITIPESVTAIGDGAFAECKSLASITIPNSVRGILGGTFRCCVSLESITIPESVTFIVDRAFEDCESLESITIPGSVTEIWESAFLGCRSLKSITIPESVTSIGDAAFSGCKSLASITIPESLRDDGRLAFDDGEIFAEMNEPVLKEIASMDQCTIFSFSHYLPRQELFPEKRFLVDSCLHKVSGSMALEQQIRRLKPTAHIFGHTHLTVDLVLEGSNVTVGDCLHEDQMVDFIQHKLAKCTQRRDAWADHIDDEKVVASVKISDLTSNVMVLMRVGICFAVVCYDLRNKLSEMLVDVNDIGLPPTGRGYLHNVESVHMHLFVTLALYYATMACSVFVASRWMQNWAVSNQVFHRQVHNFRAGKDCCEALVEEEWSRTFITIRQRFLDSLTTLRKASDHIDTRPLDGGVFGTFCGQTNCFIQRDWTRDVVQQGK